MAVSLARRARRRLRAGFVAVLAAGAIALTPGMALAEPEYAVRVTADDVELGPEFWQGAGTEGNLQIFVTNTGTGTEDIQGSYTLPTGVHLVTAKGADNCADVGGQAFKCALSAGDAPGRIVVRIMIDQDAWRRAPLLGSAAASAGTVGDGDGFAIVLPAGPPTTGIALSTTDLTLAPSPGTAPQPENGQFAVRLVNAGTVAATGAVEVSRPAGTDLRAFPLACTSHRKVSPSRDRCEVGKLDPGRDISLVFNLTVSAPAHLEVPLTGAVFGYLTAPGQSTAAVMHSSYQVLPNPTNSTITSDSPSTSDQAEDEPEQGQGQGHQAPAASNDDQSLSRQLSPIMIIGSIVGLVTIAGGLMIISVRRRLRDAEPLPVAADDEPRGHGGNGRHW